MSTPIDNYLTQIKTAVYGEEVRTAIHNSIQECYAGIADASQMAADLENSVENVRLNQKIHTNPFVIGTTRESGVCLVNRSSASISDGKLVLTRNSSSSIVSYGCYFPVTANAGDKLYIHMSGLDHSTSTNFKTWRVYFSYQSETLGSTVREFTSDTYDGVITMPGIVTEISLLLDSTTLPSDGNSFKVSRVQIVNLTEMFGSGYEPNLYSFMKYYSLDDVDYLEPQWDNDLRLTRTISDWMNKLEILDHRFEDTDTSFANDLLKSTTKEFVLVLHNNSQFGDGGACLFRVMNHWENGCQRNDGTFVFPAPSQADIPDANVPMEVITDLIKSYTRVEDSLKYGNNFTLFNSKYDNSSIAQDAWPEMPTEIDCSAFVEAILNGISYENSKYVRGYTSGIDNIHPITISKENTYFTESNTIKKKPTWLLAEYFGECKRLFYTPTKLTDLQTVLKPGDILFFAYRDGHVDDPTSVRDQVYFSTGHVAIVLKVHSQGYITIAQGGGALSHITNIENSPFVCKTATIHVSNPEEITTYIPIFARPRYVDDIEPLDRETMTINNKKWTLLRPLFCPNTYIPSTGVDANNNSKGHVLYSDRWCATEKFYSVDPGSLVRYFGTSSSARKYISDGAINVVDTTHDVFLYEYDRYFTLLGTKTLALNGISSQEFNLSSTTRYLRFQVGYSNNAETRYPFPIHSTDGIVIIINND